MTAADVFALDAGQRVRLEALVVRARALMEDDLARQAEGRYGFHPDGTVEPDDALHLDHTARADRGEMAEVVAHLRDLGETAAEATGRLVREAAFTHLNRLVAIRIAEAAGLLGESLARGRESRGFRDLQEIAPELAGDYWTYLGLCGDELAADAPALFDPRNPLLDLRPSPAALDELVALLAAPGNVDLWGAADALGWTYQFFNTGEERRAMREESPAPSNSHELAVRNQFFTPRYVVDFLVHNTLGRRLLEADPTSPLLAELPLLIDPPAEPGLPLDLADVAVLDPAVGSGHFLLGCYDVLEIAWELAGVPPAEAAPRIVAALWGIDIDPRCAQVASAAVMFRARRQCRDLPLPRPNIITARALPRPSADLPAVPQLTANQRRLVDAVSEVLADAPVLGPLLRVEAELDAEVRSAGLGRGTGTLSVPDEAVPALEADVLANLQRVADAASSTAAERLLAAEADDALRFVEAMRRRYDVVLMNPPFGEPVPHTKPYLRAAYPWVPARVDLFAAFVGRGLELCKPDGYLGAITSRAGLFLTTFQAWRREVLLGNRLTALVDVGYRVMAQAKVEAAAYIIGPGLPPPGHTATFVRLLKDIDRAAAIEAAVTRDRAGHVERRVYRVPLTDFEDVPGVPVAYWITPSVRQLFTDLPRLEGNGVVARQGLATGDDFRFVRAFWEVDPRRIARSGAETHSGKRWCPFAKGGEYGPYWSDIHLLVDYEREGERLRRYDGSRVQNSQYYFRPGLTWPRRTNSALSVRVLPAGCVFADKGPAVFAAEPELLLAWLNSRYVRLLIDATTASGDENKTDVSRSYEVGIVQSLPNPAKLLADDKDLPRLVLRAASAVADGDRYDETTRSFVAPGALGSGGSSLRARAAAAHRSALDRALTAVAAHDQLDELFGRVIDPEGGAEEALADANGPLVTRLPFPPGTAPAGGVALLAAPVSAVIEAATERLGIARWIGLQHHIADRRLELAALASGCAPEALLAALPAGLLPPDEPRRTADDLLSYLVGAAFGRWDVRVGRQPPLAPPRPGLFEPVPLCPPGMLVNDDGFPAAHAPEGYPLALPPERLLVDEAGHRWDVEAAVLGVAKALFDEPEAVVADLLGILGRASLRDHLRRKFFRDHLARYSKSRRRAPVYWPLTVTSGKWGVWIYAPVLSRETLFAVARQAARRERLATEEISRLRREGVRSDGGGGARRTAERLDGEERLAEELRRFRAHAERAAGLGWEPDLDDGFVLCAAPLADLMPSWKDAKEHRDKLRRGEFPWATVARWKDHL